MAVQSYLVAESVLHHAEVHELRRMIADGSVKNTEETKVIFAECTWAEHEAILRARVSL